MPNSNPWTVGVENPYNINSTPPAILSVTNTGVATSSKAKHSWDANGKKWHHIINPATGLPSDTNITAVTVIHENIVKAEVLSKTLMMLTHENISRTTEQQQLPTLWYTDDGYMHYNRFMEPHIQSNKKK